MAESATNPPSRTKGGFTVWQDSPADGLALQTGQFLKYGEGVGLKQYAPKLKELGIWIDGSRLEVARPFGFPNKVWKCGRHAMFSLLQILAGYICDGFHCEMDFDQSPVSTHLFLQKQN